MIKKKICMLGSFSVGKTSLVRRFVKSVFSEKYLSTVGVKIDKKTVEIQDCEMDLMLWDIHGEDEFQRVRTSYLRGAAGYFLVVDGSRADTLKTALGLKKRTEEAIGKTPCILVFNKSDIRDEWEVDDQTVADLSTGDMAVITTSAKTGVGVEKAFFRLAELILNNGKDSHPERNGAPDGEDAILVRTAAELEPIIPEFLADWKTEAGDMREALEKREFDTIRKLGHNMKGTGGACGFDEITRLGRDLEEGAKEKDSETIRTRLDAFEFFLKHVTVVYE